jgi:hypothetical protein
MIWTTRFAGNPLPLLRTKPAAPSWPFGRVSGVWGALLTVCAIAACDSDHRAYRECVMRATGERFYYLDPNIYASQGQCRTVTDTEGWERHICRHGPQEAICRNLPALPKGARLLPPDNDPGQ